MSSPFRQAAQHDTFTLLDGAKRWPLPGAARVQAGLKSDLDVQSIAGDGQAVVQLNEASGELRVALQMWEHEQWVAFRDVLTKLRRGTKDGPSVFTCAHPEVRARGIKRLYFVDESAETFSPRDGYRTTLTFREKLKDTSPIQAADTGSTGDAPTPSGPVAFSPDSTSAQGQQLVTTAAKHLYAVPPAKTRNGVNNIGESGYCSSWSRVVGTEAGMPDALFGRSALETAGLFRNAGLFLPWSVNAQQNLKPGDFVFYGATEKNPDGHVGMYVGTNAQGVPMVAGNNFVTYRQRGGLFDARGWPTGRDAQGKPVDARGLVPLTDLGTPSGIGKPSKALMPARPLIGPATPLRSITPANPPSQSQGVVGPPR